MMTCPKSSRIMWCWNEKIALNVLLDISMVNFRVYALIRKYFQCNFEWIFEPLINIFCFHASLHFFADKTKRASVDQAYSCCCSSVGHLLSYQCNYLSFCSPPLIFWLTYSVMIVKLSQGTVGWTALKGNGVAREVQLPTSQNLSWGRFLC